MHNKRPAVQILHSEAFDLAHKAQNSMHLVCLFDKITLWVCKHISILALRDSHRMFRNKFHNEFREHKHKQLKSTSGQVEKKRLELSSSVKADDWFRSNWLQTRMMRNCICSEREREWESESESERERGEKEWERGRENCNICRTIVNKLSNIWA